MACARTYLLPKLRLINARASAAPWFAVTGPDGRTFTTLAWRSSAPGSDLLSRVLPVFGLMALGIAVLTLVILRHARDAAATIASSINDRFRHETCDELLREVRRRLRLAVRANDTVARLGGDEFVIFQVGGMQPSGAARLADAILCELSRPFDLPAGSVRVGASFGIALMSMQTLTPRELARRADAALYAAKNAGRGIYRFFDRRHLDDAGNLICSDVDERRG